MVTIGEQLQLSRRLGTALTTNRASVLSTWLRSLRDLPRSFAGEVPAVHLEEFAPPTLDALIGFLNRGDRKAARRLTMSWAAQQDSLGIGLAESIRAILLLGGATRPLLRRLNLGDGQILIDEFLTLLIEELSRAYTNGLKRGLAEKTKIIASSEERLLSLQAVTGAIAQEHDQDLTLDLIARQVAKLTNADLVAVYLPDVQAGLLCAAVCIEHDERRDISEPVPIAGTTIGHVYRSGHLLVADDADNLSTTASIMAPLRTRDGVIGVLSIQKHQRDVFGRGDVELLGLFADQAAIALENARLFRETNERNEELSTLYRVGAVASRSLDLDRILNDALDHTLDALDLEAGSVYLLDGNCEVLHLRARRGSSLETNVGVLLLTIPIGEGPIGRVAAHGESIVIADARAHPQLIAGFPLDLDRPAPVRFLGVPLQAKDRLLGVLAITGTIPRNEENQVRELALIRSIGDQLGVAIDNAQLLAGREERLRQLTILNDILRAIAAVLDLESLYDAIYVGCSRLFNTSNFFVALVEPTTGQLIPTLRYRQGQRDPALEGQPIINGLSPLVIAEGRPILTDDYFTECRQRGVQPATDQINEPLSWLGVPLAIGGRLIGTIVVASNTSSYTVEDATLLSMIASGSAVAIENARAYASEQRRVGQLRALNKISRTLVSVRDLDALLQEIAVTVCERFHFNYVSIHLLDAEQGDLVLRAQADSDGTTGDPGLRIAVGQHIVGAAAQTRQPVLVNDVSRDPRVLRTPTAWPSRAEVAVPIILGEQLLGVLNVESTRTGAFDEDDVALLQTLSDGVAVGIENARLYSRSRDLATAEERNRLAREIHDTIAQGLTAITYQLEVADALLDDPHRAAEAHERVRRGLELTRENLEEARRSVMDLRAAPLQEQSLPEALEQLLLAAGREHGFADVFHCAGIEARLPSHLEAGFYRIAQELLRNVGKHARATHVHMTLKRWNGALILSVVDDGVGFDPAAPRAPSTDGGFGLIGLRERIALLGGTMHIDSAPDEGTSIRITAPLVKTIVERPVRSGQ